MFIVLVIAVPGESDLHPAALTRVDFRPLGTGNDGHLGAVHHGFMFTQGAPGFVGGDRTEIVVITGGLAATLFFHGLGLFAGVGDGGEQPFPVQALAVVFLQCHFGAGCEVRAVAFALGQGGVVSQGIQLGLGEGLAAGVSLVATGVVVVLVIFSMAHIASTVFVHQPMRRILEGVVLHRYRRNTNPLFVGKTEHAGLLGTATGFGVAGHRVQFRGVAVVVGND